MLRAIAILEIRSDERLLEEPVVEEEHVAFGLREELVVVAVLQAEKDVRAGRVPDRLRVDGGCVSRVPVRRQAPPERGIFHLLRYPGAVVDVGEL